MEGQDAGRATQEPVFTSPNEDQLRAKKALQEREEHLPRLDETLAHRIAELETAQRTLKDARRATLNLLEDVRESEATVRGSEERLRAVTSLVPDLLWSSEPDGATTWYNQRWLDYTGRTWEEALARGWIDAIHPDERERVARGYDEAVATSHSLEQEIRIRGASGQYRWFLVRAEPLREKDRRVLRMYCAATDIHDLKQAEAKLREADSRKNQFLAMLGHELRNPLAAIQGGVQLLRSEKAKPESKAAALPLVAEQVAHMERLVEDLLDLTRIVEGRVQVRRAPLVLQQALRQAIDMVRARPGSSGFHITAAVPDRPVQVNGDSGRLVQVYANILANAVKFSGASRRVDVTLEAGDNVAVTRITDYGEGISAELLPRIFDPFVQAHPGVTLECGLGMGLAVVRELVHAHDGEVIARSEGEGRGSEFEVRLPLASVSGL